MGNACFGTSSSAVQEPVGDGGSTVQDGATNGDQSQNGVQIQNGGPTTASPTDVVLEVPDKPTVQDRDLPPIPEEKSIVRALYSFQGIETDDLSFEKGEKLEVRVKDMTGDWWLATHCGTKKQGYIPRNYVSKDDNSVESQEWWFDFQRNQAEMMLFLPINKKGTFLIRPAKEKPSLALSVLTMNEDNGDPLVKHYLIYKMVSGGCYINPSRKKFPSVEALVEHYRERSEGLCCQLTDACPRIIQTRHPSELEVKRDAIQLTTVMGGGCFGEVWKGKLYGKRDVAVKMMKPGHMSSSEFLREVKVMNHLRHPKLVQLLAACTASKPYLLVMELCQNGSLLEYLRQDAGRVVKFPIMVTMAAQIAEGMAFLEEKNYIHRDLRAANILVGEHHEVKVADFGLARLADSTYNARENSKFPVKWTAPEAMELQQFSSKSDVWSFGVLLYEIVTCGKVPYPGMPNQDVVTCLQPPTLYRMSKPRSPVYYPESYYGIMLQCWRQRPEDRPTFSYLHFVFDDYFVTTEPNYTERAPRLP